MVNIASTRLPQADLGPDMALTASELAVKEKEASLVFLPVHSQRTALSCATLNSI